MLNNMEMSMIMQRYLNNSISFMKRKGHILPTLVVLNKEPLDIQVKHKHILEMGASAGNPEPFLPYSEKDIYEYGIAFKLSTEYRDKYLLEVARRIARKYKPDAIGTVSACLFRNYIADEMDKMPGKGIQDDPEAFRVIYLSYYLKDNDTPNYMVVPYIKKEKEVSEFSGNDDNFSVIATQTSWNSGLDTRDLLMPNPYK